MKPRELFDNTLIIGDVHLGGFSRAHNESVEANFLSLLDFSERWSMRIVLLGDIFDYYMQYDQYVPEISRKVLEWFAEYHARSGYSTLYITGNHDNWDFGYFQDAGFDTEHEFRILQTADLRRVFLFHGDGLADPVLAYPRPLLHRMLRNPYFVKVFRSLTNGRSGNAVMRWFSEFSRLTDKNDTADIEKVDDFALSLLENRHSEVVICGHHHRAKKIQHAGGVYLNPGAFFHHGSAILYTNSTFRLVNWAGEAQQLQPINSDLPNE